MQAQAYNPQQNGQQADPGDAFRQQQFESWFDDQISKLGEDFESVFGSGQIDELSDLSPAYRNRIDLFDMTQALQQVYPGIRSEDAFQRALRARFPEVVTKASNRQLSAKLKERSKSTIGKPSGRQSLTSADSNINPEVGVSQSMVNKLQSQLDHMLESGSA